VSRGRRRSNSRPWARTDKGFGGPGFASSPWEGECHRCGNQIQDYGIDATKDGKGRWIHKLCASGADDE
jgi:hypothetical protein